LFTGDARKAAASTLASLGALVTAAADGHVRIDGRTRVMTVTGPFRRRAGRPELVPRPERQALWRRRDRPAEPVNKNETGGSRV
jgi:hypothetical protein